MESVNPRRRRGWGWRRRWWRDRCDSIRYRWYNRPCPMLPASGARLGQSPPPLAMRGRKWRAFGSARAGREAAPGPAPRPSSGPSAATRYRRNQTPNHPARQGQKTPRTATAFHAEPGVLFPLWMPNPRHSPIRAKSARKHLRPFWMLWFYFLKAMIFVTIFKIGAIMAQMRDFSRGIGNQSCARPFPRLEKSTTGQNNRIIHDRFCSVAI